MTNNTLRFGVVRALAFVGLLVAGAWVGEASAATPSPSTNSVVAPAPAADHRDLVRSIDCIDAATRLDLLSKAAAAASIAPRGFGLVAPALIVAPAQ